MSVTERNRVTKDNVFRYLCAESAAITPYTKLRSVPEMASTFGATQYNVRQCIKALVKDGLVTKAYDGGMDDDGTVFCYHGYTLTKKGTETDIYKECDRRAVEEIQRFLDDGHEKWQREQIKAACQRCANWNGASCIAGGYEPDRGADYMDCRKWKWRADGE